VENRTNQVTYSGADRDRTDCLRNAIAVVSSEASLNLELSQVRDGTLEDPSPGGTRNPAEAPSSIAAAGPKKNGGKPPARAPPVARRAGGWATTPATRSAPSTGRRTATGVGVRGDRPAPHRQPSPLRAPRVLPAPHQAVRLRRGDRLQRDPAASGTDPRSPACGCARTQATPRGGMAARKA
jgi:hypothetical protein